ncbi:arylsulfatase F [Tupaia chinensis]|uniref:arylsulfatase F n=1 Tax=Tupaia chinensis TaxID=246437 RepID=UPI0003C9235B|nr:arylsulfatase F [Tupaia chinensis]
MPGRGRFVFLSLVCVLMNTGRSHGESQDKPNIVLFLVDDLGIGDLGCYGNDTISEGMVSDNLDRVVESLGVPAGLPRNETTFAALLKNQGYSTALIGKWHQGLNCYSRSDHCHHPYHYGFDYYYGMPFTLTPPCWPDPSRDTELAITSKLWVCVQLVGLAVLTLALGKLSGWICIPWSVLLAMVLFVLLLAYCWFSSYSSALYWDCLLMRGHDITEQPSKAERAGSIMVKEALSFLERHREGPFLLFFCFLHVHVPLPTTKEFMGTSKHGLYGDNVEEMDSMVGKILDAMDDLGLRNNTLVYLTSDHGGHLEARLGHVQMGGWNGRYKGGKGMGGWEGGIRVPGIFRWPGKLPAGKSIEEPTSLMDIFPTLASVSGGSVPRDRVIDGRDLMPLLRGDIDHSEHEFLFHYCGSYIHAVRWHPKDNSNAVWKVHYVTPVFQPPGAGACYMTNYCRCSGENVTHHDPPLLYDLSRDPSESTPLTPDTEPRHDAVLQTVARALQEHRNGVVPVLQQLSVLNQDKILLKPCCGVFPFCLCDKQGDPAA